MFVTTDNIFNLLSQAPFGVYAVSLDQTILFWNVAAEGILGYSSDEVMGRRCYEVMAGPPPTTFVARCTEGCPSLRFLQSGGLPRQSSISAVSASGELKYLSVTPVVVGVTDDEVSLILHLFTEDTSVEESAEASDEPRGVVASAADGGEQNEPVNVDAGASAPRITVRELEVLRLVSMGWDTPRIASELNISPHTVLNHIRHFRRKLNAPTKLDAVVTAIRLGMLTTG